MIVDGYRVVVVPSLGESGPLFMVFDEVVYVADSGDRETTLEYVSMALKELQK